MKMRAKNLNASDISPDFKNGVMQISFVLGLFSRQEIAARQQEAKVSSNSQCLNAP